MLARIKLADGPTLATEEKGTCSSCGTEQKTNRVPGRTTVAYVVSHNHDGRLCTGSHKPPKAG